MKTTGLCFSAYPYTKPDTTKPIHHNCQKGLVSTRSNFCTWEDTTIHSLGDLFEYAVKCLLHIVLCKLIVTYHLHNLCIGMCSILFISYCSYSSNKFHCNVHHSPQYICLQWVLQFNYSYVNHIHSGQLLRKPINLPVYFLSVKYGGI